jgi:hypothetical protein
MKSRKDANESTNRIHLLLEQLALDGQQAVSQEQHGTERRSEPRVEFSTALSVERLSRNREPVSARLRNISNKGLQLRSSAPLQPGEPIAVTLGNLLILCEVVYWQQDGDRYLVGLSIETWTEMNVPPENSEPASHKELS